MLIIRRAQRSPSSSIATQRIQVDSQDAALDGHSTSTIEFPQELIESIVDTTCDDRPTLLTCSLISRAWKARCQYHLFATTTVRAKDPDPIRPFLTFLWSTTRIAANIQNLCLTGSAPAQHLALAVSARWLTALMKSLPNLKSVCISRVDLTGLDRRFTPSTRFTIESLSITQCSTYEERDIMLNLLEILYLFDEIGELTISQSWADRQQWGSFTNDISQNSQVLNGNLRIKSLRVVDRPRATLFWLALMPKYDTRYLESLSIRVQELKRDSTLCLLLKNCGAGLRFLELEFTSDAILWTDLHQMHTESWGTVHCQSLEGLTLQVVPTSPRRPPMPWKDLCTLLSSYPVPASLRSLKVNYHMFNSNPLTSYDWTTMIQILQKYPGLKEVAFIDPTGIRKVDAEELLADERLQIFSERIGFTVGGPSKH